MPEKDIYIPDQSVTEAPDYLHHGDGDDDEQTIFDRLKGYFGDDLTLTDRLLEVYRSGDIDRLDTMIDDLTYEAAKDDPEWIKNLEARGAGPSNDRHIVTAQKELFDKYREAIIQEAGLNTVEGAIGVTEARKKIQEKITAILESGVEDCDEILHKLGMLAKDKDGKDVFVYPEHFFAISTDNKWETYLKAVVEDIRIARAVKNKTRDKTDRKDSDSQRRAAHNAVAKEVHEILGLDRLPESKWTFQDTRDLVGKMRESKFPTIETAESALTAKAVTQGLIGHRALSVLCTRVSDLR